MSNEVETQVERAVRALLNRAAFKRARVVDVRLDFGEDRNLEPAVWIFLLVPDDARLDSASAAPRLELRSQLRHAVLEAGWQGRAYTRFRRQSEDAGAKDWES